MGDGPKEIELKLRFDDEAAHARIRAQLDPQGQARLIRQTNHFIDTPSCGLRLGGIGWRIREEVTAGDPRWVLTLKGPPAPRDVPRAPGTPSVLSVRLEEECILSEQDARTMLAGPTVAALSNHLGHGELVQRVRAALTDQGPRTVGSFTNERVPLPYAHDGWTGVLELDRTVFPGGIVHHELELELTGDTVARAHDIEVALRQLIEAAGATPIASRGKASRFFEALAGRPI